MIENDSVQSFNIFYEQEMIEQEEDEKHLFRDLNAFISLISDEYRNDDVDNAADNMSTTSTTASLRSSFESIRRRSTTMKEINKQNDVHEFKFLKNKSKSIGSLLRLHLLNYLRSSQTLQQREDFPLAKEVKKREILLQWWITLLNFISGKLKFDSLLKLNEPLEDVPTSTELITIVLESISRIMTSLIILPHHSKRDHEVYCQHISLTTKFIADILVVNSKIQKKYMRKTSSSGASSMVSSTNESADLTFTSMSSSVNNKSFGNTNSSAACQKTRIDLISFIERYTDLLTTFIGKINAYAFIYLPDEYNFDYTLLSTWYPKLRRIDAKDPLFSWKKSEITLVKSKRYRNNISVRRSQVGKLKSYEHQKMCASYMKNKSIFLTFYWHYWYIILRYTESKDLNYFTEENLHYLPGASLLLNFITDISLKVDLRNFDRFINGTPMRSQNHNRAGSNSLSTQNDTDESVNSIIPLGKRYIRNEAVNNFIFTNFGTIKLWEVVRSISSCMSSSKNLAHMLSLHDSALLKQIVTIPAHEYTMANIIYNKIFQFVLFQFHSLKTVQFINWTTWIDGLIAMLDTLNINSQTVALICLFNIWFFMSNETKRMVIKTLVFTEKYWDMFMEGNQYPIIRILFVKLLIFRIIPDMNSSEKQDIYKKLKQMEKKMEKLYTLFKTEGIPCHIENNDPFLFAMNNKFVLTSSKVTDEDYLTFDLNHRPRKPRLIAVLNNDIYPMEKFPNIGSVANLRPSFVLQKGKYPYDVFDELLDNLARYKSCKKWGIKTDYPEDYFENLIYEDFDALVAKRSQSDSNGTVVKNVANTINSWFSKLSNKDTKVASEVSRKSSFKRPSSTPNIKNDISMSPNKDIPEERTSKSSGGWSFGFSSRKFSGSSERKGSKEPENIKRSPSKSGNLKLNYNYSHGTGKVFESVYGKLLSKQKVVVAPELQFSKEILSNPIVTNVVKAIQLHTEGSTMEKLDRVNSKWGIPPLKPLPSTPGIVQMKEELDKGAVRVLEIPLASSSNSVISEVVDGDQSSSDQELKYLLPKLDLSFLELNDDCQQSYETDDYYLESLTSSVKNITLMKYQTAYESIVRIIRAMNATKDEYIDFDRHNNVMIEFELYKNGHQNLLSVGI